MRASMQLSKYQLMNSVIGCTLAENDDGQEPTERETAGSQNRILLVGGEQR